MSSATTPSVVFIALDEACEQEVFHQKPTYDNRHPPLHPLAFSIFDFVGTARATHVIDRNPRALVFSEVIYHAWKKIGQKKSPPEAAPEGTVPGGL